jgi:hypothetical protein
MIRFVSLEILGISLFFTTPWRTMYTLRGTGWLEKVLHRIETGFGQEDIDLL